MPIIIGFNNVHIGGEKDGELYTNEEVIEYVTHKYGAAPSSIVRTGGCIRVTIPDGNSDGELDILSFDEWLRYTYGDPQPGDTHFETRQRHGYSVWLIKVHPEVFKAAGCTKEQIYAGQRFLYNWYCVDAAVSGTRLDPPESDVVVLGTYLEGFDVVEVVARKIIACDIKLPRKRRGVALWDEGPNGVFCLFPDDDGDLVPAVCANNDVKVTGSVFAGWDTI